MKTNPEIDHERVLADYHVATVAMLTALAGHLPDAGQRALQAAMEQGAEIELRTMLLGGKFEASVLSRDGTRIKIGEVVFAHGAPN